VIEVVDQGSVIGAACASLGVELDAEGVLGSTYLSAAVRRLAGFLCPCSPRTLVRRMVESHVGLVDDVPMLEERVESSIEGLVAIGDLLELSDVALEGEHVRGTWLVAAPPAFVVRPSGSAFILGLSADEQTPLPTEMRSRIVNRQGIRSIDPVFPEDLSIILGDLGLRELSPAGWLRSPKATPPADLVASYDAKLAAQQHSGEVAELLVLDGTRRTRSYRARWTKPGTLSGNYVVRRPQAFGSDLWGYAQLSNGVPVKLLDLPLHGDRWRGCDAAWRAQMAIDAIACRPQEYRLRAVEGGAILDLFSPIPKWARRRLAIIGSEVQRAGCLMSFLIPEAEIATEEAFLRDLLFLSRTAG
jgi:hypothetical protein